MAITLLVGAIMLLAGWISSEMASKESGLRLVLVWLIDQRDLIQPILMMINEW